MSPTPRKKQQTRAHDAILLEFNYFKAFIAALRVTIASGISLEAKFK
jgi:hypothetical protein